MRSWLTGRRDPFPAVNEDPTESGSAVYRLASELGADAQFTATFGAQWESSGRGGREIVFPYLGGQGRTSPCSTSQRRMTPSSVPSPR